MDPTRNAEIEELFAAALELAEAERAVWLEREVADPALRAEVGALLAAAARPESLLDRPLPALAALAEGVEEGPPPASLVGRRFGAYHLEELIGQGGSAAVYRATREVGGARQTVAVKILRRGLHAAEEHRLFLREQRLLARLEHPDIARWIDGGVTPEGIPFLVVEYVEGEPLTVACERRQLSRGARLKLFVQLCRAVGAAHAALIVHRDLKPQNILLSAGGQLKVLDFGVAKLLDEADNDSSLTASGRLTPGYAAPEQIDGGAITVATDVFALGVLLAELLLGRRPARQELGVRALRGAGLAPAELAHVVGQACAPEAPRRYGSVAELREDVERLIGGEPVRAHPPSLSYRTRKFVARHRVAVAATLLVVASLTTATVIVAAQAGIARDQAHRAARAAATSKAVQEFMVGLFSSAAEQLPRDRIPTTRELLDLGVARARADFAAEPDVAIDLLRRFAQSYSALHLVDRAVPVAEEYFNAARARYGEESVETALARLERGRAAFLANDFAPAETEMAAACALLERLTPGSAEWAECEGQLGSLEITTGRIDKGIARSERAGQFFADACAAGGGAGICREAVVTGYAVALAESWRGGLAAGRDRLAPLVERGRTMLTDRRLMAQMLNSLGAFEQRLGAYEPAERHVREGLTLAEALGETAADVVLECRSELAAALASRGDLRGAADELSRVVDSLERLHPQGHRLLADHRTNLAVYLIDLGELSAAEPALGAALVWFRGESPVRDSGVARVLELTARMRALQGRLAEARTLGEESLRLRRVAVNPRDLGSVLFTLARIHLDRGDPRAALAAATEGYAASVAGLGEGHPLQALRLARLGDAFLAAGDRTAASEAIARAERWSAERLAPGHPSRCRTALSRARLLLAEGDAAAARRVAHEACGGFVGVLGPGSEAMQDLRLVERSAFSSPRSAASSG